MKIAILDDHELIRVGIAGTLQSTPHTITISVPTAVQLFEALEAGTPCDIVLLDILMPDVNGVEVAERLRNEYPDIKIIVLSIDNREFTLMQLLKIGMDGFVSKSSPLSDIPLAIDSVANGVPFYGRDIAILIRDITDAKLNNKNIASLSKREIEIIKACCDGLMGKEIADKEAAGKAIIDVCTTMTGSGTAEMIGEYRGFFISIAYDGTKNEYQMHLKGAMTHTVVLGADVYGNVTRMDNVIDGIAGKLKTASAELTETQVQMENAREEMKAPFAKEDELKEKEARLKELNILLNMDQKDRSLIDDTPEEDIPDKPRPRGIER